MRIKVDRDLCIGVGTCAVVAPNTFEIDDELKAVIKDPKGHKEEILIESAKVCPVFAIILEDSKGKQIYP
jgi:ferredoxin